MLALQRDLASDSALIHEWIDHVFRINEREIDLNASSPSAYIDTAEEHHTCPSWGYIRARPLGRIRWTWYAATLNMIDVIISSKKE
jgi:hypothetical protein